ncbi:hypothetical protein BCR33DRAFT_110529 [Rhizoclosmatium globosum]|uniref:Uncharacterized protein n=1 Tax=Rhizoclosmatium globosum TaxID=329046 RepID=A0A1Y2CIF1_9FUNG|nr:hypothetical protein BCR33DRAFT_110529 [Rhizoclosmatium globosum]|eukprot:ORY46828.1 hypothetical protein BCR33DRAFT_110529 [Rhizoclosmatium globosum]
MKATRASSNAVSYLKLNLLLLCAFSSSLPHSLPTSINHSLLNSTINTSILLQSHSRDSIPQTGPPQSSPGRFCAGVAPCLKKASKKVYFQGTAEYKQALDAEYNVAAIGLNSPAAFVYPGSESEVMQ